MSKIGRIGRFILYSFIAIVVITDIRNTIQHCYYLNQAKGNYTVAMQLMDRVHPFNPSSYINGWLHCLILVIMCKIITEK
jgi:hypothetical protein